MVSSLLPGAKITFSKIGSIYRKVLSVDYTRMDYARVLVITDYFLKINNPILFSIGEKTFKIFATEELGLDSSLVSMKKKL